MITLDNLRHALRALYYEPSGDGTVYQEILGRDQRANHGRFFPKKRIGYPRRPWGSRRHQKTQLVTSPITRTSSYSACVTMLLDRDIAPEITRAGARMGPAGTNKKERPR